MSTEEKKTAPSKELEDYIRNVDELAQKVVDAWAAKVASPGADSPTEFTALFAKACEYRNAKRTSDNHRMFSEYNVLFEQDTAEETTTRQAFAVAFKDFEEKNDPRLGRRRPFKPFSGPPRYSSLPGATEPRFPAERARVRPSIETTSHELQPRTICRVALAWALDACA